MPSNTTLFYILFYLAYYTVKYYLGVGSWAAVYDQYAKLRDWFAQVSSYINSRAKAWGQWAYNSVQGTLTFLENWRVYLAGRVTTALNWVTSSGKWVYEWLVWADGYLNWVVKTGYTYLVYFVNTGYNYLVWIVKTGYNYLVWLASTGYTYLVYFVKTGYNYLVYFVNTGYTYLVYFVSTGYTYLVYFVSTGYNYLVWFIQTGYDFLTWLIGEGGPGLKAFIRDAMTYWYNVWAEHADELSTFLSNPGQYILIKIRDGFLDWLEQEIADNW